MQMEARVRSRFNGDVPTGRAPPASAQLNNKGTTHMLPRWQLAVLWGLGLLCLAAAFDYAFKGCNIRSIFSTCAPALDDMTLKYLAVAAALFLIGNVSELTFGGVSLKMREEAQRQLEQVKEATKEVQIAAESLSAETVGIGGKLPDNDVVNKSAEILRKPEAPLYNFAALANATSTTAPSESDGYTMTASVSQVNDRVS